MTSSAARYRHAISVERLLTPLLTRDPSGREWLSALLSAAPRAREQLGELAGAPGSLSMSLSVRGASGRLAAFEHPVAAPRELERWWIEHPDRLTWPEQADLSPAAERLRRALLLDEPAGARARAQERARTLLGARSALAREWWRFEEVTTLDCVLMTERLVITIQGAESDPAASSTPWYPPRTRLARTVEAARQLAGERRWCSLVIGEVSSSDAAIADDAVPHLDEPECAELFASFLGVVPSPAVPSARQGPEAV